MVQGPADPRPASWPSACEQARARRRPADVDDARRVGAALVTRLRGFMDQLAARGTLPEPETAAHAALGEAEATRLLGRSDPERWAAAVTAFEALGQPYPAAYARWREAEAVLAAHGPRARAAAALRRANAVSGRLGASPLRHEIQRLAQRARINLADSLSSATDRSSEPSPAERLGLTRREREVLALVAAGLTNERIAETLFISPKTAGNPRLQYSRQIRGSRSGGGGDHRPQGWPRRRPQSTCRHENRRSSSRRVRTPDLSIGQSCLP